MPSINPAHYGHMLRIARILVLLLAAAIFLPVKPATVAFQTAGIEGLYRNPTEGFSIRLPTGLVRSRKRRQLPAVSFACGVLEPRIGITSSLRSDTMPHKQTKPPDGLLGPVRGQL